VWVDVSVPQRFFVGNGRPGWVIYPASLQRLEIENRAQHTVLGNRAGPAESRIDANERPATCNQISGGRGGETRPGGLHPQSCRRFPFTVQSGQCGGMQYTRQQRPPVNITGIYQRAKRPLAALILFFSPLLPYCTARRYRGCPRQ